MFRPIEQESARWPTISKTTAGRTSSRRTCWTSTPTTPARPSSARRPRCSRSISTSWPIRAAPKPVAELHKTYPSSCGENAYAAIEPTKRLFAAARARRHADLLHHPGHAAGQPAVARHRDQAPARAAGPRALRHPARVQAAAGRRRHHQAARRGLLRHAADGASDAARHPDRDRLRRKHVGLRARLRGRRLFATASTSCWWRNAASTAACCRTRSTCSTCTTNIPT